MKSIVLAIVTIVILGGFTYFLVRDAAPETSARTDDVLTIENVPNLLRGTTIHVPVDEERVDVLIDSYASGGTTVLGGTTEDAESTVTVFIPEFSDTFTQGAWGIVLGTHVLVPTYINFGGTGQFFMIALFTYDKETKKLTHNDLNFIDDRIAFDGMVKSAEDKANIMYRSHAEGTAMSDEPTVPTVRPLRITADNKLEHNY